MNIENITCESTKKRTKTQKMIIIPHQVLDVPAEGEGWNSDDGNNIPENCKYNFQFKKCNIIIAFTHFICRRQSTMPMFGMLILCQNRLMTI